MYTPWAVSSRTDECGQVVRVPQKLLLDCNQPPESCRDDVRRGYNRARATSELARQMPLLEFIGLQGQQLRWSRCSLGGQWLSGVLGTPGPAIEAQVKIDAV